MQPQTLPGCNDLVSQHIVTSYATMLQHVLCLQAVLVETMRRGATTTTYVLYVSYNYYLLQLELEDPRSHYSCIILGVLQDSLWRMFRWSTDPRIRGLLALRRSVGYRKLNSMLLSFESFKSELTNHVAKGIHLPIFPWKWPRQLTQLKVNQAKA